MSKRIQITNDENTGQPVITNGQRSRQLSRAEERALLENGGTWQNGNFEPFQEEWEIGNTTLGIIPANDAAKTVVKEIKTRRGLFG